ncbi:MAG: hypothetical protein H6642_07820 [Caldilineaceae bacterium]|nr:hypothetical protein [Caldilineaceae bacterium]
MKLPNFENAVIDIAKLRDYCLNPSHRRGQYKARVFAAALGLSAADAEELQAAIAAAIGYEEAMATKEDQYGQRYVVDFRMRRAGEQQAQVRTMWIIRAREDFPRLTSCYVP